MGPVRQPLVCCTRLVNLLLTLSLVRILFVRDFFYLFAYKILFVTKNLNPLPILISQSIIALVSLDERYKMHIFHTKERKNANLIHFFAQVLVKKLCQTIFLPFCDARGFSQVTKIHVKDQNTPGLENKKNLYCNAFFDCNNTLVEKIFFVSKDWQKAPNHRFLFSTS